MSHIANRQAGSGSAPIWHKDRLAAVIILLVTFAVFRVSPVRTIYDSSYTMLFSQQLLQNHRLYVESRAIPELNFRQPGEILRPRIKPPYQLYQQGERFYDFYPPGSAVLSIPYVAAANLIGISAIDHNGVHDARGELRIQRGLAPLLMALFCVTVFFTSRLVLSLGWSILVAGATAFGTQVWSDASRAVWSQTWGIFVLGIVVWLIVRAEARRNHPPPIWLATWLSWLYFIRPTFSTSILAVTIYVFLFHRRIFMAFIMTGALWLTAFVVFSEFTFGHLLPPYYNQPGFPFWRSVAQGLTGNLISPSRGLLIYVPILFFVGYLLIRYRPGSRPRLVILVTSIVIAHLIVCSLIGGWHGGHCYGPRLSMDAVPWLALLGILAVQARVIWHDRNASSDSKRRIRAEWAVAGALLTCSVAINAVGAISLAAWEWNIRPNNIDYHLERVWDWKQPQFLAPLTQPLRQPM